MLNNFTKQKFTFDFNKRVFEIYNKDLIPELLGKRGKQTAINVAGSTWKKIIKRYNNEKQEVSVKQNSKYIELLNLFNESISHPIRDVSRFDTFKKTQTIMVQNLIRFKKDVNFRTKVTSEFYNEKLELKKKIPIDGSYILLCLYIASNCTYFDINEKNKFTPIVFKSKNDFLKRYYQTLLDTSFKVVNNLTCFCYRQYFWMDYRLSDSNRSAIHSIIQNMFYEMDLLPHHEIPFENASEEETSMEPAIQKEDVGFRYPDAKEVDSKFIELTIVPEDLEKLKSESREKRTKKRVIDFEKENKRNKRLGDQGELIVFYKEKEYLREKGLKELANKVRQISKEDDKAGYDILSFELDGKEKRIEVKSTNAKPKGVRFYMSSNQYKKAKELDNYYSYIVFEAKTETPKIWKMKNPLQHEKKGLIILPSNYRVIINVESNA